MIRFLKHTIAGGLWRLMTTNKLMTFSDLTVIISSCYANSFQWARIPGSPALQVVTAILLQCSQNLKIWCDDRYWELSIKWTKCCVECWFAYKRKKRREHNLCWQDRWYKRALIKSDAFILQRGWILASMHIFSAEHRWDGRPFAGCSYYGNIGCSEWDALFVCWRIFSPRKNSNIPKLLIHSWQGSKHPQGPAMAVALQ